MGSLTQPDNLSGNPSAHSSISSELAEEKDSKAAVEEAVDGLEWAHAMSGESSPTDSSIVQSILERLKRKLAKLLKKKLPFTAEMLQLIVQDVQKKNTLRLAAACLLLFARFLRFDELSELQLHNLAIGPEHLTKTDKFRQGKELVIARTGTSTCPMAMLEAYMAKRASSQMQPVTKSCSGQLYEGMWTDSMRIEG